MRTSSSSATSTITRAIPPSTSQFVVDDGRSGCAVVRGRGARLDRWRVAGLHRAAGREPGRGRGLRVRRVDLVVGGVRGVLAGRLAHGRAVPSGPAVTRPCTLWRVAAYGQDDADGDGDGVRLWVVRHGPTEWSSVGKHTGSSDIPLTEEGEREAASLRDRLAARRLRPGADQPAAAGPAHRGARGLRGRRGRAAGRRVGLRRLRGPDPRRDPREGARLVALDEHRRCRTASGSTRWPSARAAWSSGCARRARSTRCSSRTGTSCGWSPSRGSRLPGTLAWRLPLEPARCPCSAGTAEPPVLERWNA